MEYTIKNLAKLAGVSTRTLRYYDEIGLLKPCRTNSSGYRIYGTHEVNRLQQILFYKELELPLETIKSIMNQESFSCIEALHDHKQQLLLKQQHIEQLLQCIDTTIQSFQGGISMSDQQKFEAFKKNMIEKNDEQYGEELREKYGEDTIVESYKKVSKLTKEQWNEVEALSNKINALLKKALKDNDPASDVAQEAVRLHYKWLHFFSNYPPQAHLGLGQMYVDDPRFTAYYENHVGPHAATLLRNAIAVYYNATFDETTWQWTIKEKK